MQLLPGFGPSLATGALASATGRGGPGLKPKAEDPDILRAREKQLALERGRKGRKSTIIPQVASLGFVNRPRAGSTLLGGG